MALSKFIALSGDAFSGLKANYLSIILALPVLSLIYWVYIEYTSYINVPAVGVPPGIFGRLKAPYRWRKESRDLLFEGVKKYGEKPFKVRLPGYWTLCLTEPTLLRELKDLPASVMSFRLAADELNRAEYTFGEKIFQDGWHLGVIKKNLTENLVKLLPEIVNEVTETFEANLDIKDDWTTLHPYEIILKVIARTTNRILVGAPLCYNDEYLGGNITFAINIFQVVNKLQMVPQILRPILSKFIMGPTNEAFASCAKYTGPIFEERIRQMQSEKWDEANKPNDAFQWIIEALPPRTPLRKMIDMLIFLNVVALHTSAVTTTHILFDLASNTQYQTPLRDEIETHLRGSGGWTKNALTCMKKLDSVIRESARMNGANIMTMLRIAKQPHTFSDGTHVPKDTLVVVPSSILHRSEKLYENPDVFDGFRFYNLRQIEGNATRFQSVSATLDYLPFGEGLYACPGRFFATNEIKIMVSHLVCNYEFKFEDGAPRPPNMYEGIACFPDLSAGILIRNRKDRKDSILYHGGARA